MCGWTGLFDPWLARWLVLECVSGSLSGMDPKLTVTHGRHDLRGGLERQRSRRWWWQQGGGGLPGGGVARNNEFWSACQGCICIFVVSRL